MNVDLNKIRYMSDLLDNFTDSFYFMIGDVLYILDLLNKKISFYLGNCDCVDDLLSLYEKIVKTTDKNFVVDDESIEFVLTGTEAAKLLYAIFCDSEDSKVRDGVFQYIYESLLNMTINDK